MDLRYSEVDEKFRKELRAWLAGAVPKHGNPPPRHDWDARRAYDSGWQRKLFDAGYAGVNWPKEYGGRGATLTEELVYYEEIARARALRRHELRRAAPRRSHRDRRGERAAEENPPPTHPAR